MAERDGDPCRDGASPAPPRSASFQRCNIFRLPLAQASAHDGSGVIRAARIATADALADGCRFLDYAEVPPGTSIGPHRHADDEEEYYLVLSGSGEMRMEADVTQVVAGDLIRNPAGGLHGLTNRADDVLRLFIFAVTSHAE